VTIAIVGAGWLGCALADALPRPDVATTRSGRRPPALAADVEVHALDVAALPPVPPSIAAARAWVVGITPGRDQDRRALYVDGARALCTELPATLERVVWISSTSALPDVDGDVDEDTSEWPTDARGRVQREAEAIVLESCACRGVLAFVLRMGGLYGPGRELERIYRTRDENRSAGPLAGDGMTATNLVHRDDAIAAIVASLAAPAEAAGIIHVVDDDHCSRRAMFEAVARRLDRPPPEWAGPPGPTVRGKRVTNARLHDRLGVRLRHPTHGGEGDPARPPPSSPSAPRPSST
jgi:nucleoside-diphosphate-sugar epimerase